MVSPQRDDICLDKGICMKVGDVVVFKDKVYRAPYAPYYDEYAGHRFVIEGFSEGGHVSLVCLGSVEVDGSCHIDEIELEKSQ